MKTARVMMRNKALVAAAVVAGLAALTAGSASALEAPIREAPVKDAPVKDAPGLYRLAPAGTAVTFTTGAFGVAHTTGRVSGVEGTLRFDADHPADSRVDVKLDMTTLSSGVGLFDGRLQGDDYFDTARYPQASFRSTQVDMTGETTATVTGDMTLHGVTRTVVMAVAFDRESGPGLRFTATARIHRRDFGIDKFELFISNDIDLHIAATAQP